MFHDLLKILTAYDANRFFLHLLSKLLTFSGNHVSPYNFGLCRAWCHHKRGSLYHNQQEKGQIHVPWLAQNFDSLRCWGSHLLCSAIFPAHLVARLFAEYLASYIPLFVAHHANYCAYIRLFHHSHKVRAKIIYLFDIPLTVRILLILAIFYLKNSRKLPSFILMCIYTYVALPSVQISFCLCHFICFLCSNRVLFRFLCRVDTTN